MKTSSRGLQIATNRRTSPYCKINMQQRKEIWPLQKMNLVGGGGWGWGSSKRNAHFDGGGKGNLHSSLRGVGGLL